MKGVVIYKGKYGSTAQYASWLAEALYLPIIDIDSQPAEGLAEYDYVMVGSPVYVGKLLMKNWLLNNQSNLQHKKVFLFVVCGSTSGNNRMQEIILKKNVPTGLLKRMEAFFLPGRVVISQLSWFDRMLLKFGAIWERDPAKKQMMVLGFDGVKREHVNRLIKRALRYSNAEILQ